MFSSRRQWLVNLSLIPLLFAPLALVGFQSNREVPREELVGVWKCVSGPELDTLMYLYKDGGLLRITNLGGEVMRTQGDWRYKPGRLYFDVVTTESESGINRVLSAHGVPVELHGQTLVMCPGSKYEQQYLHIR